MNPTKLSFIERAGYSMADAAANFVFMTMILFQLNFYTDVFGLSASAAAAVLLWPRLWDAVFDPVMGVIADRTNTRWGKFRPWILWTAVPLSVVMVLAYTTPEGWSNGALIAYAVITNALLMTLYSMNNMPYSALGGVITADLDERARLNSYRFIAVKIAQYIVGSFRGGALYNYYHHYADKAAMFGFLEKMGLTAPVPAAGEPVPGGLMESLGYIVHGTRDNLAATNVDDVFNSIANMTGTLTTILVILASASFARRFGKKAVAVAGVGLSTVVAFAFSLR